MGVGEAGSRKVIVSHPTGNTNVTAVVNALNEQQLLEVFYTCLMWRPESKLARLAPGGLRSTLQRRARVQLPEELVRTRPTRELVRNLLIRAGKKRWVTGESRAFSIDGVYRDLDRMVARELGRYRDAGAVYAYDDGALHHFRRAPQFGLHRIYDLPIGYWRANQQISLEEAERKPEWKGTLNSLADSPAKLARKDEELELADTIAVPSTFVKNTLERFPGAKKRVYVNPFGVPANIASPRELTSKSDPLRVLYVGSLTQRKGIAYLFDAVEKAGKAVTLTVIGRKVGHSDALDRACARHRWISSVPHTEILAEMRRHDVFVFPSLFEGLALVNGEAVSQGLPVITTFNSGGTDILRDGKDSFVVPIRDADAITERLLQLHDDRELLKQMSDSALQQASALDWSGYKQRTVAMVREVLGSN